MQGKRRSIQSILKEINLNIHWKDWCWSWSANTLAIWCEELTHWKRPWCWERLRAGGEGGDRGWDGRMASLAQCTWVWASSGRQWRTGKPGVLQSMGSQRVGHDWAPERQQQHAQRRRIVIEQLGSQTRSRGKPKSVRKKNRTRIKWQKGEWTHWRLKTILETNSSCRRENQNCHFRLCRKGHVVET